MYFHVQNFTSVTVPNSVTSIRSWAFGGCASLTDFSVYWTTPLPVSNDLYLFANVNTSAITLHVPAGTKTLYESAEVWKDFGTIVEMEKSIIFDETQPVGSDGKGTIALNLSIPSDVTLTGSFEIQFPEGMTLDEQSTVLSLELSGNFFLSFTYKGDNTWLIEIKSNAMKSSASTEFQKIMDIAYTVDEYVPRGLYEVEIMNLDFLLDNSIPIKSDLLIININIERYATSIKNISNQSFYAYYANNMLKIESSYMEIVTIYSAAGVPLYSTKKDEGLIEIPFKSLTGSMFIIKGSVSGAIKLVK